MRFSLKYFLAGFALIALALPAWARTQHFDLTLDHDTMIGSTQVPAGSYEIKVDDGKTNLMVLGNDGKVVTEAHGQWVKLPAKAEDSEAMYNGNRLTEVQFQGRIEAFQIS